MCVHSGVLREAGLRIRFAPKTGARTAAEVTELMGDAVAAIVSSDPFDASVFRACPRLRVLARSGVGVESIDLDAATEAGVVDMVMSRSRVSRRGRSRDRSRSGRRRRLTRRHIPSR